MTETNSTDSPRIPVDYSVIGIPHPGLRVEIPLLRRELDQLSESMVVTLTGDAVPDHQVRVVSIDHDRRRALVEFVDD